MAAEPLLERIRSAAAEMDPPDVEIQAMVELTLARLYIANGDLQRAAPLGESGARRLHEISPNPPMRGRAADLCVQIFAALDEDLPGEGYGDRAAFWMERMPEEKVFMGEPAQ